MPGAVLTTSPVLFHLIVMKTLATQSCRALPRNLTTQGSLCIRVCVHTSCCLHTHIIHLSNLPAILTFIHAPSIHITFSSSFPPSTHSSIYPSIHTCIYPSTHSSIYPSIHTCIYPSTHSSIYPFIHTCIYPSIHSSIHPRIHPTIHLPVQ